MNKLLLTATALTALTTPAHATEYFNPYIGTDYLYTNLDFGDDGSQGLNGFNLHMGNKFTKNIGLELGYFTTDEDGPSGDILGVPVDIEGKLQGVTLDAMGYLPVTDEKLFDLIGTVGVSYIRGEAKVSSGGTTLGEDDDSEVGFRAGAGGELYFHEYLSLRGLARYQTADFDGLADDAWQYSLGLNWNF